MRTAQDYEDLRASVLDSVRRDKPDEGPIRGPEIGTVCDLGLASWLKQPPKLAALSCVDLHEASRAEPASPTELTRVIADIVVALALETGHA